MNGSDRSYGQSRDARTERVPLHRPVSVDAIIMADEAGNDVAYLRAVMKRERKQTTVTVTEEMIVENDAVKHWERRAETASGEHITRRHTIR